MTFRGNIALFAALGLAFSCVAVVRADNETRRAVGSRSIDEVFDLTGKNVVMGQIDGGVPTPHNDVTDAAWYSKRAGDAPKSSATDADDGRSLHALEVAAIMIGRHDIEAGMAPAAKLFADRFDNNDVTFGGGGGALENEFLDSLRHMMTNAVTARVVNASVVVKGPDTSGTSKVTLGVDYLITQPRTAGGDFLFVKSAGNSGTSPVTVPGDNFNGLTVGALTSEEYQTASRVHQGPTDHRWGVLANFSDWGPGRGTMISKPDLVAPGGRVDTNDGVGANKDKEIGLIMATGDILPANGYASSPTGAGNPARNGSYVGTSYAAPHVSGIAAQLYQMAPATEHKVMKAVLMNSADKTVRGATHEVGPNIHGTTWRASDPPWTAIANGNGLDARLGAGAVDAWGAAANLQATGARMGTGQGGLAGGNTTTNLLTINNVGPDARIVATVTWDRRVGVDAVEAPNERFAVEANQAQFDLAFNRQGGGGVSVADAGGSVVHMNQVLTQNGNYTLELKNKGNSATPFEGQYAVAWAVSPPDVKPNTKQPVYFTVRDQIHRPRAERTDPTGNDRILEGRPLSTVNARAIADAGGQPAGVDSSIYKSTFDASTVTQRTGTQLGLMERNGVLADDHVNDISFGNDAIRALYSDTGRGAPGGQIYFSVDTYATGLSPHRTNNPQSNGVYSEATIVNESAGDVFVSSRLEPNRPAITNGNAKNRNRPDADYLGPAGGGANANANSSYADSYYMGLVGGRVADNEDDVTGLEGLGGTIIDVLHKVRQGYYFFTLDRDSPSGHLGEVLVAREDIPNQFRSFATADQLGLTNTDNIDGLCVQWLSETAADGWPVYSSALDQILFSVDRDSTGVNASAVRSESVQGEVASDIFFATTGGGNSLFLEGTDLGLQEFGFTNSYNWLTDNLDALDIPDAIAVPEPATLASLAFVGLVGFLARRRRRQVRSAPRASCYARSRIALANTNRRLRCTVGLISCAVLSFATLPFSTGHVRAAAFLPDAAFGPGGGVANSAVGRELAAAGNKVIIGDAVPLIDEIKTVTWNLAPVGVPIGGGNMSAAPPAGALAAIQSAFATISGSTNRLIFTQDLLRPAAHNSGAVKGNIIDVFFADLPAGALGAIETAQAETVAGGGNLTVNNVDIVLSRTLLSVLDPTFAPARYKPVVNPLVKPYATFTGNEGADIESTVLHEVLHALGLQHPDRAVQNFNTNDRFTRNYDTSLAGDGVTVNAELSFRINEDNFFTSGLIRTVSGGSVAMPLGLAKDVSDNAGSSAAVNSARIRGEIRRTITPDDIGGLAYIYQDFIAQGNADTLEGATAARYVGVVIETDYSTIANQQNNWNDDPSQATRNDLAANAQVAGAAPGRREKPLRILGSIAGIVSGAESKREITPGVKSAGDVDYYKITSEGGRRLLIDLDEGALIGDRVDTAIELFNSNGTVRLAFSNDDAVRNAVTREGSLSIADPAMFVNLPGMDVQNFLLKVSGVGDGFNAEGNYLVNVYGVPEPSSWMLLVLGVAFYRRFRIAMVRCSQRRQ